MTTMPITRVLTAVVTALAHITILSASSVSAYYGYYSNPCNKEQCCWALNMNHWDTRNLCYGCEGQNVCPRKPTPRPTKKPTKKPAISWRNDGWSSVWNSDSNGGDRWGSGARQNFCCQTTGNCPIDTPVATRRQWLDRANRIRLTYCCQRSISSWQGDSWSWRGGGQGRSLQQLLPLCVNTDMPTISPTLSPTESPSVSVQPSSVPSSAPSVTSSSEPSLQPSSVPSSDPSNKPSLVPSSDPSNKPSLTPSSDPSKVPSSVPSLGPSFEPSGVPSSDPSSEPSMNPSLSIVPSSEPSLNPSVSTQPSDEPSLKPSKSLEPSDEPSIQPSESAQPSNEPSLTPSESSQPSSQPSLEPSKSLKPSTQPSFKPSESAQPSSQPITDPARRLVITAVIDGPLTGETPKAIQVNAREDIPDLSLYGLESVNGAVSSGAPDYTFPQSSLSANSFFTVANNAGQYGVYFSGASPSDTNNVADFDGNDAILLYYNASNTWTVVDSYGVANESPSPGNSWNYKTRWVRRDNGAGPSATYVSTEWTKSGDLTGCTQNSGCAGGEYGPV